jgi:N-acetylmuramoyl-L-alanine amidase
MVSINDSHRVAGARIVDFGPGGQQLTEPRLLVLHYSAGSTLGSAEFALKKGGNSYHVLIDTDGSYHQIRPFNRSAGHAGRSNWKAQGGLDNGASVNRESIGISFINLGGFMSFAQGRWFWDKVGQEPSMADEAATKAALTYRPGRPNHWTPYTQAQLEAGRTLVAAILERYPSIQEIVGHQDVAIEGKIDPGPLCPIDDWRRELGKAGPLGFESEVRSPDNELNLRDRPSGGGTLVKVLRNGDPLHIRALAYTGPKRGLVNGGKDRALSGWASVDIDGSNRHAGFVYLKYLTRTPLLPAYAVLL